MPYVDGLGVVSYETALKHEKQVWARIEASADWINDKPVSEFAKLVEAECFRTGKSRQQVCDEYRDRQHQQAR
jgi:hypothetical protein